MKLDIGAVFEQVLGFYLKLPLSQKIALPLLAAGCMGIIMFVSNWATRPEYGVLFSNLSEADAAMVVEKLQDEKIGYRLANEGKTIEVTPARIVHETRLELASAGLPKGDQVGFELFNEAKLGLSATAEMLNVTRATQGELERTILKIDGVSAARIHITNPKRSVFASRDILPTASVLLKLKAGTELTQAQTKGIAHLVAGSIERLTPDNVTILDQRGKLLNDKPSEEETSSADITRLQYQRDMENAFGKRIETMLQEVLGTGKAIARVTANVDFNSFEKEEESYDPSGSVTRSERAVEEGQNSEKEGGVPGVLSNLTNQPSAATGASAAGGTSRKETVKNYEVSRAVSKITKNPGRLERLSVAVLVDGQYIEVPSKTLAADGTPVIDKKYVPLSQDMMTKVDNLVKQAVGYDASRGDIITVENIKFADTSSGIEEMLNASEHDQLKMNLLSWVPAVVLFFAVFMFVMKPLVRFLVTPTDAEVDLSRLLPAGVEELEAELQAERAKLSSIPEKVAPTVDIEELEGLLSDNSRLVKDNPQQAALLIRYWLNDGRM